MRAETIERRTAVSLDALAEVDADFGQIDVTEVYGAQHVVEIMLGRVPLIYKTGIRDDAGIFGTRLITITRLDGGRGAERTAFLDAHEGEQITGEINLILERILGIVVVDKSRKVARKGFVTTFDRSAIGLGTSEQVSVLIGKRGGKT